MLQNNNSNIYNFKDFSLFIANTTISGRIKLWSQIELGNHATESLNLTLVMGINDVMEIISYCASKGALTSGVKSMALELASKKIRMNCVSPAFVETELLKSFIEKLANEAKDEMNKMHPLGLGHPSDIANAYIYTFRWIKVGDRN